ncbi:hypothetical protein [Acinetobacter baumannii]|uniref:hypothetical protein n=1 Tax=Acinetobacter baumannii TaxID=470 RepID=UPI0008105545|nr:hypothetical protein [Acinetobacter baumannii]MDC5015870.1 hypothetical protein [Acinetobacter baumannii]WFF52755.1 hypothetical protein OSV61_13045 [Acinetobacter baumannii]
MSINLEREINKIYDNIINSDDYQASEQDQTKLKAYFLSEADKLFSVPFQMSGSNLRYSYYFQGNLFADINLLECPNFDDREGFTSWFIKAFSESFDNLHKL